MKTRTLLLLTALCGAALTSNAASSALLGWNNLGMHCMDSEYAGSGIVALSVFEGPWRPPVFRLPRIYARGIPQLARE